jgi:hypothetical protein
MISAGKRNLLHDGTTLPTSPTLPTQDQRIDHQATRQHHQADDAQKHPSGEGPRWFRTESRGAFVKVGDQAVLDDPDRRRSARPDEAFGAEATSKVVQWKLPSQR